VYANRAGESSDGDGLLAADVLVLGVVHLGGGADGLGAGLGQGERRVDGVEVVLLLSAVVLLQEVVRVLGLQPSVRNWHHRFRYSRDLGCGGETHCVSHGQLVTWHCVFGQGVVFCTVAPCFGVLLALPVRGHVFLGVGLQLSWFERAVVFLRCAEVGVQFC